MKGYIHVYTGNGKGKTTAALGLALRAVGAGLKVYIAQFVKGMHYSELDAIKVLSKNITVKQYGRRCFIKKTPEKIDVDLAQKGFTEVKEIMLSGKYDIIILDEINIAIYYNLISEVELLEFMDQKPESIEIILTGRYATDKIMEKADLITEMKEVKHYYQKNVEARIGIEK